MTTVTAIVLYFIIWWVVLFAVLPWGVHRAKNPEVGHDPGAPERPMLVRKVVATSLITLILWGVLYYLIDNNILVFRDL